MRGKKKSSFEFETHEKPMFGTSKLPELEDKDPVLITKDELDAMQKDDPLMRLQSGKVTDHGKMDIVIPKSGELKSIEKDNIIVELEDLSIVKLASGDVKINKLTGGMGDSTYSQIAVGKQKVWNLIDEKNERVDIGESINGNRPFSWTGKLAPGQYTLITGPVQTIVGRKTHLRGFKVTFNVP